MVAVWKFDEPGLQKRIMKKVFFQATITVILFFSSLFILRQIDWMSILKIEEVTQSSEEKLGELFWDIFKQSEQEIHTDFVVGCADSLLSKICTENNIERSSIQLHLLHKTEVNALALPNRQLVLNSGLILACESQAELSAVICHELAHIELDHVMKKLMKEVSLSVLISMTSGNVGPEIIKESAKLLSSTAFDRRLEKEADLKAIDYLVNANIDHTQFANFLFKLSIDNSKLMKYFSWVSTHPDSKERVDFLIHKSKEYPIKNEPILQQETWELFREKLKSDQ